MHIFTKFGNKEVNVMSGFTSEMVSLQSSESEIQLQKKEVKFATSKGTKLHQIEINLLLKTVNQF